VKVAGLLTAARGGSLEETVGQHQPATIAERRRGRRAPRPPSRPARRSCRSVVGPGGVRAPAEKGQLAPRAIGFNPHDGNRLARGDVAPRLEPGCLVPPGVSGDHLGAGLEGGAAAHGTDDGRQARLRSIATWRPMPGPPTAGRSRPATGSSSGRARGRIPAGASSPRARCSPIPSPCPTKTIPTGWSTLRRAGSGPGSRTATPARRGCPSGNPTHPWPKSGEAVMSRHLCVIRELGSGTCMGWDRHPV
jgi:hypothetical protein